MKVLLLGNYPFDGSTSMKVWADALCRELAQRGIEVQVIAPRPIFGRIRKSSGGIGKWFGYIDRFVLFPRELRAAAASADLVHICDHGSAVYTFTLKNKPTVVTCHDMLAIRGAMGEVPDCPASLFGKLLQRRIKLGMQRAARVACVSKYTFDDACRILNGSENLRIVLNGLNYPYRPLDPNEIERRLAGFPALQAPFVLHVGSNLARKNREGVMRIFAQAATGTGLRIVFAGVALNSGLMELARELRIEDRIVQVEKPEVEMLEALYNRALALLFPSRCEGFGWPPIEAQACGCPVIGSNIPPLAEVLLDSAVLHPLEDEAGMAEAVRKLLTEPSFGDQMRQRGFENVRTRFQTARMIDEYIALYRELV
jgi:glycosyltransferase involved in cell wall biosynthesis